jgi:hypothetical protein
MIEINTRAKKPDPWATPDLLTIPAFREALEAGKYLVYMRKNEHGEWEYYDNFRQAEKWPDDRISNVLAKQATLRIRARTTGCCIISKGIIIKNLMDVVVFMTINDRSRSRVDARIQDLLAEGRVIDELDGYGYQTHRSDKNIEYVT